MILLTGHFYTSSKEERNSIIADLPQYEYEGAAFGTVTEEEADSVTGAHTFILSR